MRYIPTFILMTCLTFGLAGCGDTMQDIRDAASGINSKANEAATALSMDVHSMRATEIKYNEQVFTVNDVFKTILRDVQWHYEQIDNADTLKITGTWTNNGLFEQASLDDQLKKELAEHGKVTIQLTFTDGQLDEQATKISLVSQGKVIIEQQGVEPLYALYDLYQQ